MILEEVFIIIFFELKVTTAHLEPLRMTSTHVYQGRTVRKPTCHQLTSVTPVQRANIVNGEQVCEWLNEGKLCEWDRLALNDQNY